MLLLLQMACQKFHGRSSLWLICQLILSISFSGVLSLGAERERAHVGFHLNGKAASDALRAGLPRIAVSLFRDALSVAITSRATTNEINELKLGLTTALLAAGDLADAKQELTALGSTGEMRHAVKLRYALIAFLERDHKKLKTLAAGFNPETAPPEDKPWIAFLRAMILPPGEKQEVMLSAALKIAVSSEQHAEFKLLRYREDILATGGSEVLAANLKRQMEEFRGRTAGREFAVQYVMVLYSLGKEEDALAELRRQLELAGNENGTWRDRLLLLYGLIAPVDDGTGRAALESLVQEGKSHEWMEMGLYLLTSRTQEGDNSKVFLDKLLQIPRHPLTEQVINLRLKLSIVAGENELAETCARRLMEEFPGSPRKPEALRALAAAAWRVKPPKYRLVADLLTRLLKVEKDEVKKERLSAQVADCHFLAGDYESAAALYLDLRATTKNSQIADRALSQAVNASLASGDVEKALRWMNELLLSGTLGGARWEAEWNLIARLKEMNRVSEALKRTQTLLTKHESLPADFHVRFMWLDASLSLTMRDSNLTLAKTNKALDFLVKNENLAEKLRHKLKTQLLLTKGRALLRAGRSDEGLTVLADLREGNPDANASAFSFLVEAYYHAAGNRLDEAQRSLLRLADGFKGSRYAPRALYEAALYLERRGQDENLKEGVDLLERLIQEYPSNLLVFYARIRQANLLRSQNEFGAALELCEELLGSKNYQKHSSRVSASMLRTDCLSALAKDDRERLLEVAEDYAQIKNSIEYSIATRAEAAYKEGVVLRRMGDSKRAKAVFFRDVIQGLLPDIGVTGNAIKSGKYWIARSIFDLAEILGREGETDRARNVYRLILAHGLPGYNLALNRVSLVPDKVDSLPKK